MKLGYNLIEKLCDADYSLIKKYIESDNANAHIVFRQKERGRKIEFKKHHPNGFSGSFPGTSSWIQKEIMLPLAVYDSGTEIFISPHRLMPLRQPSKTVALILDINGFILSAKNKQLKDLVLNHLNNKTLKKNNAVITSSISAKKYLCKYFGFNPERVHKLYSLPPAEFAPIFDERKCESIKNKYGIKTPYFICAGDFTFGRNLKELFEFFKVFGSSTAGAELVIADKGNSAISALSDKYNSARHKITCLKISDATELAALYNGSLAFVSTASDAVFPDELLEAIFCGIPVISYKNQFSAELLADAGILIGENEKSFYTKAMKKLFDDPKEHLKWRAKSLERSRMFSSSNHLKIFSSILDEVFRDKYMPDEK